MLKKLATPLVNRDHNEPRFRGFFWSMTRKSKEARWIALFTDVNTIFDFASFSCIAIRFLILLGT